MIKNNEVSSFAATLPNEEEKGRVKKSSDDRKLSVRGGKPQLYVSKDFISLTYENRGIVVTDSSVIIGGKGSLVFANKPSEIRVYGYWTFNDTMLTTLPSTIYTPIPVLNFDPPNLAKIVASKFHVLTSAFA